MLYNTSYAPEIPPRVPHWELVLGQNFTVSAESTGCGISPGTLFQTLGDDVMVIGIRLNVVSLDSPCNSLSDRIFKQSIQFWDGCEYRATGAPSGDNSNYRAKNSTDPKMKLHISPQVFDENFWFSTRLNLDCCSFKCAIEFSLNRNNHEKRTVKSGLGICNRFFWSRNFFENVRRWWDGNCQLG